MSNSIAPRRASSSRVPATPVRGQARAVPNTYAQGMTNMHRIGSRAPVFDAEAPEPTEIECLRGEVAQMRIEAQEYETKIEALEDELSEYR